MAAKEKGLVWGEGCIGRVSSFSSAHPCRAEREEQTARVLHSLKPKRLIEELVQGHSEEIIAYQKFPKYIRSLTLERKKHKSFLNMHFVRTTLPSHSLG